VREDGSSARAEKSWTVVSLGVSSATATFAVVVAWPGLELVDALASCSFLSLRHSLTLCPWKLHHFREEGSGTNARISNATLLIKDDLGLHILGGEGARVGGGEDYFKGGKGSGKGGDNGKCDELVLEGKAKCSDGASSTDKGIDLRFKGLSVGEGAAENLVYKHSFADVTERTEFKGSSLRVREICVCAS